MKMDRGRHPSGVTDT